jgi:hypothetical protein
VGRGARTERKVGSVSDDRQSWDEERDTVAPEPEFEDPADAGGDSPGVEMGVPDEPLASDGPGTTAAEQREPSLERRLEIERPDVSETGVAGTERERPPGLVDDDVAVEDLNVEEPMFDVAEADMDRTREASAESTVSQDEGPEADAMHVEPG